MCFINFQCFFCFDSVTKIISPYFTLFHFKDSILNYLSLFFFYFYNSVFIFKLLVILFLFFMSAFSLHCPFLNIYYCFFFSPVVLFIPSLFRLFMFSPKFFFSKLIRCIKCQIQRKWRRMSSRRELSGGQKQILVPVPAQYKTKLSLT